MCGFARRRVSLGEVNAAADSIDLLVEFAKDRSETAFATLVHRHLNLVYSVALRRCGGQPGLAAEVCQTVFIDLARKAARLSSDIEVAGWLHRHACFVTAKLLRAEHRRRRREEIAMQLQTLADTTDWSRIAPLLDEALLELPRHDRDPLALRYLEQRTFADVGARLGLSENTARMRVDRALDKLRAKLAKRGVTSTASALAIALAGQAVTAAPAALATTVTTAAVVAAAATASTFGLFTLMASTKLQLTAGAVLLAATGTALVLQHQAATRLRSDNAALQGRVAQLTEDAQNARQSATRNSEELARLRQPLTELLRLRGEVNQLHRQLATASRAAAAGKLAAAAQPVSEDEANEAVKAFSLRRLSEAKTLVLGLYDFALEHDRRSPDSLAVPTDWLKNHSFAVSEDKSVLNPNEVMRNLRQDDYELMFKGSLQDITNPAEAIVVREREAWQTPNSRWARTYGFADGHSEVHSSDDGDYTAWEAQHQVQPKTGNPAGAGGK